MRKLKATIYKEQNYLSNKDLYDMLIGAITEVRISMLANIPISKNGHRVGFGLDKAKKAIAVDNAISILRQIKSLSGW